MSTYNAKSSGRRSGRGRRRERRRDDDDRPSSPAPKAPGKQSLWQKIVSLFTGKKSAPAARSAAARPAESRPAEDRFPEDRPAERRPVTTVSNYPDRPGPSTSRPSRKPEAVEVTSAKLYVGNLSFETSESDLSELFGGVGSVRNADIVSDRETERSKGFGFVTMGSVEEAKRAVEVLHDKEFMGRKLVVSGAKTPADR